MIRRPPRSTLDRSSAASDVYKRQVVLAVVVEWITDRGFARVHAHAQYPLTTFGGLLAVSYTHLRAHETVLDLVCRLLLEKKTTHTSHVLLLQPDSTITNDIERSLQSQRPYAMYNR